MTSGARCTEHSDETLEAHDPASTPIHAHSKKRVQGTVAGQIKMRGSQRFATGRSRLSQRSRVRTDQDTDAEDDAPRRVPSVDGNVSCSTGRARHVYDADAPQRYPQTGAPRAVQL